MSVIIFASSLKISSQISCIILKLLLDTQLNVLDNITKRCEGYAAETRCIISFVPCVFIPSVFLTVTIKHNSSCRSTLFYIMHCSSTSLYISCFDTIMYAEEVELMGVF
jgi:hypothetical protein